VEDAFSESSAGDFFERAERQLSEIQVDNNRGEMHGPKDLMMEVAADIQAKMDSDRALSGWTTGFAELDRLTRGLKPNNLFVIAARPSMGKTSLGFGIGLSAALEGAQVAIFSAEEERLSVGHRMVSSLARVCNQRLESGSLDGSAMARVSQAMVDYSNLGIFVNEQSYPTPREIASHCRRLKARPEGLDLVIADYVQFMGSGQDNKDNREQEIRIIIDGLKQLAKELDIPVIALSQCNRMLERRPDKRPIMSDLLASGAIEQAADIIAFVYRDEVYHEDTTERGIAELIVRKNRRGPIGTVRVRFLREYSIFVELV